MRKIMSVLLALIFIFSIMPAAMAETNLIANGDFSMLEGELPQGWNKEMWYTDAGISKLYIEPDGYEGSCVAVENIDENDARFAQTVEVEPDSLYRISAMVKAEDCPEEGYGATLSIEGLFCYSDSFYDTNGRWEYVEFYGRTGEDQTELTVFARVGAYGYLTTGKAWFDNIEMAKVEEAPMDAVINDFYMTDSGNDSSSTAETDSGEPARYTEAFLLMACLYVLAVLGFARKYGRAPEGESRKYGLWFILMLSAAMILRIVLAMRIRGYNTDINCFYGWSERLFSVGIGNFYSPDYFCDYPPGYMLLLLPVAAIRNLFNLNPDGGLYLALLKFIPMACDLLGAYLVWRIARKHIGNRAALALSTLYAFNPAAIVNSAVWGQIDAVLTLLIVLCALEAIKQHYVRSLICFAAALLIKPQALLFAPLGLAAMIVGICANEKPTALLKKFLLGAVSAVGILYAMAFIFCIGRAEGFLDAITLPVRWMFELYSGTMGGYQYVTINTLNLHYLLGLNWARADEHQFTVILAWILFGLSYVYAILLQVFSGKKPARLMLNGGLLIILICTFGPMIHERYIFPAMLLLALAYVFERDKRIMISLVIMTATLTMNEILVLQGGMTSANFGHLQDSERWLNNLLSIVNILNALFLSWTAFCIQVLNRTKPIKPAEPEDIPMGIQTLEEKSHYKMNLRRIDAILMCIVTLVYSVAAFTNLGDTSAPETGWTSSISGEAVVFDLGEIKDFRMTYYGGICNSNFGVELSNDGTTWSEQCYAKYNQGEIFRWIWYVPTNFNQDIIYDAPNESLLSRGVATHNYASSEEPYPMQTARYVRITAQSAGLVLHEVGFLDAEGNVLPIAGIRQIGQTEDGDNAALLIDEQNVVAAYPSYLNSTYFDEIYHARTAYEHLHGMNTYEWTHPPLGKVTMMLGVQLFGMTPFGWRFMGALVGVLMVPLMYLMVKQLTKSTKLSFIAMCLMALDSMHFTQTRIATIDSYAVFWIMLMYLFMFRYCQMNWNQVSFKRTLIPLGLCGVTMGVAWATKWIGIYASAGLAILFFWTIFRRAREYYWARKNRDDRNKTPDFWKKLWITIGFCVVFFVIVPVLIYYFSYYWHLKGEGLGSFAGMLSKARIERVIDIQKNIFGYHSGLGGDTHYFRSPWYQWPIIWWPMWYFSGTAYMPEGVISSISCMGNPAVWWFGLIALIFVLVRMCWLRRAPKGYVMVIIAFASQFLPWVIVPRSTFIYHYFASVPFIIIASVMMLDYIRSKSHTAFKVTSISLLAAALILFVMFYPLESGLPVARSYAQLLRWFKWYNF